MLAKLQTAQRARLRIYIGAAPGVGKTYSMIEDAHAFRRDGVDVVVGFVETHGRAETEAKLADLEIVPRRRVDYRGVVLEEMDVDAILARKPQLCVVDELAHTNVPGSRHEKRYQDVLEILDAEERLEAWCATGGDAVEGEWSRAELEEHVRDEHSTFTWILEPMLERTGFAIESAEHTDDGIFAQYVLRAA